MTDYDRYFPSKFLRAANIEKPVDVTIVECGEEKFENGETADIRPWVKFDELEKPLVLNRTNFKAIADIAGSENMNEWAGTVVNLFVIKVQYKREVYDAIRIREPQGRSKKSKIDQAFDEEGK